MATDPTAEPDSSRVYTITELINAAKDVIEDSLGSVYVEGELASFTRQANSGHCYFEIKDGTSLLSCTLWRSYADGLDFEPAVGQTVVCFGKPSIYNARSAFQLNARKVVLSGIGKLKAELEKLRKKLEAEGLFAAERKKPLPALPLRIGLISSAEGAAVKDFHKVLRESPLAYKEVLYPSLMQGEGASTQVIAGMAYFQRHPVDIIVITRGGGSFEDLMAFNDEALVRAVAASPLPVLSAVGHERDWTLCDEAADIRCATPTDAARVLRDGHIEAQQRFDSAESGLVDGLKMRLEGLRRTVEYRVEYFSRAGIGVQLDKHHNKLDYYLESVRNAMAKRRGEAADRLKRAEGDLMNLSIAETLRRGFALLTDLEGKRVRGVGDVEIGDEVEVRLAEGGLGCKVTEKRS